jgi:xylan 1,4-beta-xylosidase
VGQPQNGFEEVVNLMRQKLSAHERFRDIPIEIAEFAILRDEHNRRLWSGDATEWGASWYAGIAEKVYRLQVAQVHQWATTTAGLHHPRAHIHTMLNRMEGGRRLAVTVDSTGASNAGAIAAQRDEKLYVLLYSHRALRSPSINDTVSLTVRDPRMKKGQSWRLSEWRVDRTHGVFIHALYEDCRKAGLQPLEDAPRYGGNVALHWGPKVREILRKNNDRYAALSALPKTRNAEPLPVGDGRVELDLTLAGHGVRLFELSPLP